MEQYYYNHMDKQKQAAYHAMLQGIRNLTDEFQIPALDADSLYNVFFSAEAGSSGDFLGNRVQIPLLQRLT